MGKNPCFSSPGLSATDQLVYCVGKGEVTMAQQATQKKIIATAERLILRRGYDGTSLNDVVSAAGVSKGAFFHYFPSKQAVSRNVLEKYAKEQIFAPLEKNMSRAPSVKQGLLDWLQETYNAYAQWKFSGGCLLGNFALELSDKDEEMREQLKAIFLQWENQLAGYLKPLASEGKMKMEPRQFARLLISAYQGATMTAKVHKDNNRASREFQAIGQLIESVIVN
jgi:TetR/AcrR family transcriptional repressor of nem operon